jgi:hypothetical protein
LNNAFGRTQYEGHGPGDELLGDPATALELGSSRRYAVAALATKGIDATRVDLSPKQIEGARAQWGHLPNAHFVEADVLHYLGRTGRPGQLRHPGDVWGRLHRAANMDLPVGVRAGMVDADAR